MKKMLAHKLVFACDRFGTGTKGIKGVCLLGFKTRKGQGRSSGYCLACIAKQTAYLAQWNMTDDLEVDFEGQLDFPPIPSMFLFSKDLGQKMPKYLSLNQFCSV